MKQQTILRMLPQTLLPWYEENKRDLPWRKDTDPYHVWVSEIMLQQTRVEAVKGYFNRFVAVLPTIEHLAHADDGLLNKLWEGLGYYSRVRNMKKAALKVCETFGGRFPVDYKDILSLPGIGVYTAGAISSIAFNQPIPAVDGNVLRVFTRLTENSTSIDLASFKKYVFDSLSDIYPKQAGAFTQALMELGATVCIPNGKPGCSNCPCMNICRAFKSETQMNFPVKPRKKERRIEEKTVFILNHDGEYALEKRPSNGLLANLWQFPNEEGKMTMEAALYLLSKKGIKVRNISRTVERKHIFTHVEWLMTGVYVELSEKHSDYVWMSSDQINADAAIPTAFRQFWEEVAGV